MKKIIPLALLVLTLAAYSKAASPTTVRSIDELAVRADVLELVPFEVDSDLLTRMENIRNDLRREHEDLVEYERSDPELVPAGEILCRKIRYTSGDYGKNEGPEVQHFARCGFVVLATQYRGVDGGTGKDVKLSIYPELDHSEPFIAFLGDYFHWLKLH